MCGEAGRWMEMERRPEGGSFSKWKIHEPVFFTRKPVRSERSAGRTPGEVSQDGCRGQKTKELSPAGACVWGGALS